jgi:peptidoglycan/LPS O-acetylase OafA/YrhL
LSFDLQPPPAEPSVAIRGRIPQLDGLRAVAILFVFLAHALRVPLTWVGVDIFFVLSGFLITGILLERKISGGGYFTYFYTRRIFRILPPYILTVLVFGILFSWSVFRPWPLFVFFGMNLQRSFEFTKVLNPLPLWSLAVEEQFYLFWPFVILFVSEKVLFRIAVSVVVIVPFLRFFCAPLFPSPFSIYMLTPFRADLLCAGAALSVLWKHRTPHLEHLFRSRAWLGCVAGFGGLALVQLWPVFRLVSNTRLSNGVDYSLSVLGSFSLLAWALSDHGLLRRLLASRPMRFAGQISYTMYLSHVMMILLVKRYTSSLIVIALGSLAATIVYSSLSWFLMERPLITFASRKASKRAELRVAATAK